MCQVLAGVKGAQISPEQSDLATSPDVQEADKHVVGATVSVDELTVQPELTFDYEPLDDDTDNDPSTPPGE